jgi:hypothetical protein
VSFKPLLVLLKIINLNEGDADAAVLAGHDRRDEDDLRFLVGAQLPVTTVRWDEVRNAMRLRRR